MCLWLPVLTKIKMAARVTSQFCKFISQISLEYDASMSQKEF